MSEVNAVEQWHGSMECMDGRVDSKEEQSMYRVREMMVLQMMASRGR